MKQRIAFLAVLLIAVLPCSAQFRAGIKGGANLSQVNMNINGIELDSYDTRTGAHAGFMTEYMFSKHLGLHAELGYFNSGANINPEQFKRWFDVSEDVSLSGHLSMHTIQLPLYLKTKFTITPQVQIYLMGGGLATYALKGEMFEKLSLPGESPLKISWSLYEEKVQILDQESTNIHKQQKLNLGLAAEAGVELSNGITIGIGFRQVLNNMAAISISDGWQVVTPKTDMWTANLSVGYWF